MYLTVDDKKTYAYTANRAFDAKKPTVVFVHGAANDHSVWSLQSRYYAYQGWNALAVDLPGHGKSVGSPCSSIGAATACCQPISAPATTLRLAWSRHKN